MNRHPDRRTDAATLRRIALAALALLAGYAAVFYGTGMAATPRDALLYAATNALPLAALALAFGLAARAVAPWPDPRRAVTHAALALSFAAAWYGAIVVLQALLHYAQGRGFVVHGFAPQALAWQTLQGFALYAAIAATGHALARPREAATVPDDRLERYFNKSGDAIHCVDVRDIVSIAGALDYSDVTTTSGRHLARLRLADFERRLDPARFLRIHRSAIVNLEHFDRAEPAGGGCFLVTLRNGATLRTSRDGAKKLRAMLF